jgi:thiol-disulfide isomerase/thioredoxin
VRSIPAAWRWTFVGLIAVIALAVALWPRTQSRGPSAAPAASAQQADSGVTAAQRSAAALAACPRPAAGDTAAAAGPLAGISLDCLSDGRPVNLAAALAGRPALVNLWAYWCQPCAQELPALQQFADRAGSALTVLTVHSDPDEAKALARLQELNVHLPGVQDGAAQVRAAVGAPPVLPVSVLVRADGSIAKVEVQAFTDAGQIAETVAADLGVRV